MARPELVQFEQLGELFIQQYERYLPTAFDSSMTMLEKVNKVIQRLDELGRLTSEVVQKWNEVMKWLMDEGLQEEVIKILEEWYSSGKFADLVIQIIDELKDFGVKITTYGADPTGKKDSIDAIEKAIATGFPVFVPNGRFAVSRTIKLPSGTILFGTGIDSAVLTFMDSVPLGVNLVTNKDIDLGNQNLIIHDITLDGNNKRFGTTPGPSGIAGTRDSNLTLYAVENAMIYRVKSVQGTLHGIDITCAGIEYPYLGDGTTAPRPSRYITIADCEASGFGDDGITTHHSEYITIINSFSHSPRLRDNCNGFEIDDGSRHITLVNNRSKGCYSGIEIKAHSTAPASFNVVINGHMSIEDVRSYNFRHIGHHSATDPLSLSARNIVCNSLMSIKPNNVRGFQDETAPRVLAISAYMGVVINGITAYTDDPTLLTDVVIAVQFNARNVTLNGVVLTGFSRAENGIYIIGGSRGGDSVNISNITLNNSGRYGVSIGSGIENVNISNVSAIGDGVLNPIAAVATINSNPSISGVAAVGYPTVCRVAGTDYQKGIALFNGAFRAASSSSGAIHEEGFVLASTASSKATLSKSGVVTSSSSEANGERSLVVSSSASKANREYNTILGSIGAETNNTGASVIGSGSSRADGNRGTVISSYGVKQTGSYKVNGGYGEPDVNGNGLTANIKWELDSLNGNMKSSGAITGSNVWTDYAEYFESEDRKGIDSGYLVTLVNGKIRKANGSDKILGSISETAGMVLGESTWEWSGKYLRNDFGGYILEPKIMKYIDDDGVEHTETYNLPKLNPEYDETIPYIPRSKRPEWNIVGLLGQVLIRIDNTVDIGDGVNPVNGIGTKGDTGTVMEITKPYNAELGYGIAKILLK
jgi:hypothetical protein